MFPLFSRDVRNLNEYQRSQFNDLLDEDEARLAYLRGLYKGDLKILARLSAGSRSPGAGELTETIRAMSNEGRKEDQKEWHLYPQLKVDPNLGSNLTRVAVYGSSTDAEAAANMLRDILGKPPVNEDFLSRLVSRRRARVRKDGNRTIVYLADLRDTRNPWKLARDYYPLNYYLTDRSLMTENNLRFVRLARMVNAMAERFDSIAQKLREAGA